MEPTLPGFGTSFVGRAGELAQLDELAAAGEIVVVTGPPGVGKSRLVAQWAAARGAEVARVPLAAARDLEDALRRVARALELDFGPSDDEARVVERIGQVLRSRAPLLWLDDADAVIELLAEPLARWLDGSARDGARGRTSATRELPRPRAGGRRGEARRRADRSAEEERARSSSPPPARGRGLGGGNAEGSRFPEDPHRGPPPRAGEGAPVARTELGDRLRFVLTSRRARVDVPHAALALAPLPHEDARRLLVERARAVRPDFAPSSAQGPSLDALVRRLDALPLAIELIAPRLRLLSPAQLAKRLESTRRSEDALRLALERSFELLQPWERDALAQCAVFRDGFYLEAAERVVDLSEHPGAPDVLTVLESLVAQSLLRTEAAPELPDEVRVRHLGAVHELAASELARDPARRAAAERRHSAYYVEAAERWDEGVESPDEVEHTARLLLELPNLEAAFERSESDPRTLARLGLVLHLAHQRRGPFTRQRELVDRVSSAAEQTGDPRLTARADLARARVFRWEGDLARSDEALARALAASRRAGDLPTEASCARNLAANRFRAGDLEGFRAHLEEALDAARRSGRASDEVNARNGLGYLYAERGEVDRALSELERALHLAEETRIPGLTALVHASLSALMLRAERLREAERHSSAAIAIYEQLGYVRQWAGEHLVRARARLLAGDFEAARADAAAALDRASWLGLDAPANDARITIGAALLFARDFGGAHEALERALSRMGAGDAAAARAFAYAGAARALLGHLAAAREAFERAGGGELGLSLSGALAVVRGEAPPSRAFASAEARRAAELLAALARETGARSGPQLEVGEDARWFRLEGGARVDLTRKRALRAVLSGVIEQHDAARGEPMSVDAVLEAGWPGERMSPESGARRVYVTINRLRKLGLEELLLTTGDGYMLAPHVSVVRA